MRKAESKKNWSITSSAFHRLLDWLDEGKNSDGLNYLQMRRRLVTYFDRKNCAQADDLADKTLNRVARRLEEEGKIESESTAKYCYITARFIFMEHLRENDKKTVSLESVLQLPPSDPNAADNIEEKEMREKMLDCLEQCTAKLEPASRETIIGYYFGTQRVKIENRRALAGRLGISINALSIRACRIRDKLEICVEKCTGET